MKQFDFVSLSTGKPYQSSPYESFPARLQHESTYISYRFHLVVRQFFPRKFRGGGGEKDVAESKRGQRNSSGAAKDTGLDDRRRVIRIPDGRMKDGVTRRRRGSRVTMSVHPGLFCPTSSLKAAFVHRPDLLFFGSDQITGHEALLPTKCGFPLHRIGNVRGLGNARLPAP